MSDAQLQKAMQDAGQSEATTKTVVDENAKARIDGLHAALGVLALIAVVALFFTGRIPRVQPGHADPEAEPDPEPGDDPKRVPSPAAA